MALSTKDQSNQSDLRWANYILFYFNGRFGWATQDETDILFEKLLCWHDSTILLRGEVWSHRTNLITPWFIEGPVPSQENEWSCKCLLGVSSIYEICLLHFLTVRKVWYSSFSV